MSARETNVIGKSVARVDAAAKVSGQALYPGDLARPNMVPMKILFAERSHARITRLDTSKAEAYPGVVVVFTAKGAPVNEYGLQRPNQPVLCGLSPFPLGEGAEVRADVVRFVSDQPALVVDEGVDGAAAARSLIEVEFEHFPVVTDPVAAMQSDAALVHPERGESNVMRQLQDS